MAALIIIFGIFAALAFGASQMNAPYQVGASLKISLSLEALPTYAIQSVLRMFIALFFSLLFTFTLAPLAAKSRSAEKLLIPLIDILQSIPILGVLSITIVGFISLFPNSILGPECAAIFAIFTSQVWNMILSFYQSFKTIPKEYYETSKIFHLSGWQCFWRIELPHAIPSLLWNTMLSLSAGWFFVVASEAISVSNQHILLPGIGSYISQAIIEENLTAIFYAIITMLIIVLLYDQLLFRPLLIWTNRFKLTPLEDTIPSNSWFYNLLTKTRWIKHAQNTIGFIYEFFLRSHRTFHFTFHTPKIRLAILKILSYVWNSVLILSVIIAGLFLWHYIRTEVTFTEIQKVFFLGSITLLKVVVLIIIASCLWFPIGVWIGLRPAVSQFCQPLIQFLAAFPVNLIYPIIVMLIIQFHLNIEIWTAPLMILGTQWYILFNVIAGASNIPKELQLVTQNLGIKRWLLWKRLFLPAIFPYYITGAITAAGGSWNASIVAEVLQWGNNKFVATGLGSYIAEHTAAGDFQRIALGMSIMSLYVIIINRLLWDKLYKFAASRFVLE